MTVYDITRGFTQFWGWRHHPEDHYKTKKPKQERDKAHTPGKNPPQKKNHQSHHHNDGRQKSTATKAQNLAPSQRQPPKGRLILNHLDKQGNENDKVRCNVKNLHKF